MELREFWQFLTSDPRFKEYLSLQCQGNHEHVWKQTSEGQREHPSAMIRTLVNGFVHDLRSWPTMAKPTLAKPTLTSLFCYRLWPNRLWPKPTLAKPTLAKSSFICCVVCCVVLCCVLSEWRGYCFTVSEWGFMCGCWFQGLVWTALPGTVLPGTALPLDRPSPGPPKISLFFYPLPPQNSFFSSLSGVFSWNFGGVFEGRDPQMCTFGLSGCRVKPRRPHQTGPPGLHTTTRELQTRTFERPGASNTTKIPREDPQRGKKRTNFVAGDGKKARNFGPPTLRAPWVSPLVCKKNNKQFF